MTAKDLKTIACLTLVPAGTGTICVWIYEQNIGFSGSWLGFMKIIFAAFSILFALIVYANLIDVLSEKKKCSVDQESKNQNSEI